MKRPDISFVIPAYNAECYLAEAIHSCLSQSHKNIEVVVVNDGSTDSTRDVADWYAERDKRVRVFHRENAGRGAARNFGNAVADAGLIAVLDADDASEGERAANTLELARENPGAFLYGGADFRDLLFKQSAMNIGGKTIQTYIPNPFNLENTIKSLATGIVHSTVAYPRALWERYPYDEGEYASMGLDDWHQQMRIASDGVQFAHTPKILSAYRILDTGISAMRDEGKARDMKRKFLDTLHAQKTH